MEKLPITNENSQKLEHSIYEREKEADLVGYEDFVSNELNEALKIKEELEPIRRLHEERDRNKDQSSVFEMRNKLEMNLRQHARNIIAKAKELDEKYNMHVERPNFKETLGEEELDYLESQMNKAA